MKRRNFLTALIGSAVAVVCGKLPSLAARPREPQWVLYEWSVFPDSMDLTEDFRQQRARRVKVQVGGGKKDNDHGALLLAGKTSQELLGKPLPGWKRMKLDIIWDHFNHTLDVTAIDEQMA